MQTCVTLLKNIVLAFQLANLKPMNLLIKFRLLCHPSMEYIPVITTVNLVIVHNLWGHQPSAAIRLRKPYRRLVAAMSQENRKIYHIIPTIVNLLITHLIFSMNPITHWNWKLQIWINQFQSKVHEKFFPGAITQGCVPTWSDENVCFHCRKHGHFAYECPDLCPPSRADKDSNWRHSMKQRNVHESTNGNRHFNQSSAHYSIDIHNVPSVQNNLISDISIIPQPQVCTVQK